MTTLYLVRGLPGSGKSTFVQNNKADEDVHVEADMYFYVGKEYRFDADKLHNAHKWCKSVTESCLTLERNVWVSNTFTTMKEMKPYLNMATELGCNVVVYRLESMYGSIHNVPEETIAKMRDRFSDYTGEIIVR